MCTINGMTFRASICIFILICFGCTNVRTTAEWKLNCSK